MRQMLGGKDREMRKVIFALLVVMALSLALVTPVIADEGGTPNDNAAWGAVSIQFALHSIRPGLNYGDTMPNDAPLAYGSGGIPACHGIQHGP
jgi:hypothetical protein